MNLCKGFGFINYKERCNQEIYRILLKIEEIHTETDSVSIILAFGHFEFLSLAITKEPVQRKRQ